MRFLDDVEGGNDVSSDGRGRRNACDARILARDDAHDHRRSANLARGRGTCRAAKARTILGSGRDVGCVQHQDRMARAVRWIRRSGKYVSHGDEQR